MSTDGNLSAVFQAHMKEAHWQRIESTSTGMGMPDLEYCFPGGDQGWIEMKTTSAFRVEIRPHQIAWLERRRRAQGRAFVAVRRKSSPGPRKGASDDSLWLFDGLQARALATERVDKVPRLGYWPGGPAKWGWSEVRAILIARSSDKE